MLLRSKRLHRWSTKKLGLYWKIDPTFSFFIKIVRILKLLNKAQFVHETLKSFCSDIAAKISSSTREETKKNFVIVDNFSNLPISQKKWSFQLFVTNTSCCFKNYWKHRRKSSVLNLVFIKTTIILGLIAKRMRPLRPRPIFSSRSLSTLAIINYQWFAQSFTQLKADVKRL